MMTPWRLLFPLTVWVDALRMPCNVVLKSYELNDLDMITKQCVPACAGNSTPWAETPTRVFKLAPVASLNASSVKGSLREMQRMAAAGRVAMGALHFTQRRPLDPPDPKGRG